MYFRFSDDIIDTVEGYNYLGMFCYEHLDYTKGITVLSQSAGRALSAIISKFKHLKDVGFGPTGVIPICDYFSEIWGTADISNAKQSTRERERADTI